MNEIKWIKLATDIFDNRKMKIIENMSGGDTIIVIWLKLLCLAGTVNDGGMIYLTKDIPFTDDMLASVFGKTTTELRQALDIFIRLGMISVTDNILEVSNWEKYQNIESMDKIREQNRIRQKRFRESHMIPDNVTVTLHNGTDKEEDKDKEKEKSIENRKRFVPPTVDEVRAYASEKGYNVDADRFVNFYESKNWMVGKNKMTNWKSALSGWAAREKPEKPSNKYAFDFEQRNTDYDAILWENLRDEYRKG